MRSWKLAALILALLAAQFGVLALAAAAPLVVIVYPGFTHFDSLLGLPHFRSSRSSSRSGTTRPCAGCRWRRPPKRSRNARRRSAT